MFICEVAIYIYEGERQTRMNVQERSNVPTFHLNVLPRLFWQTFRGKPSLFKTEVVTFSPLYRFSVFSRAGYIINARNHPFLFFPDPFFFTMVSRQHQNRLLVVKLIFEKKVPVIFLCSGCKTTNPDHFEKSCIVVSNNNVYSRCVRFGRLCDLFFSKPVCK